MSKSIRGRITFSNVVAVIALFVALGGTAFAAAKLSGKSIKPKSIPANRIKPKSLTSKQVKPNSLTSKQIKDGTLNQNATYVTNPVSLPADPGATSPVVTATATCPAGQKAIGGGAVITNPDVTFINDVGPTPDATGWLSHVFPGATATTINITAVCTKVGT